MDTSGAPAATSSCSRSYSDLSCACRFSTGVDTFRICQGHDGCQYNKPAVDNGFGTS